MKPVLGFSGSEVDTHRTEGCGARLLRGVGKDVSAPGDLERGEPRGDDRRFELCFQQSTSDSTGPEVDLFLGALGYLFVDQDVPDL